MPRYSIGFSSNLRPRDEPHQSLSHDVLKVSPKSEYQSDSDDILNLRFKIEATKVATYNVSNAKKLGQDEISHVQYLRFDLKTIKIATNNFSSSRKIGEGGYGSVYKGVLPSGKLIAVKRLSYVIQGEREFKNEVVLLAKLQHRNLVWLQGFCSESKERLLIYEFVPNSGLDGYFNPIKKGYLNWERRYKIIGDIARGLLYLHEDSSLRILHRDLKSSNILLDAEMNAKIGDFGLALLCPMDQTQVTTRHTVGTSGYMAPEYLLLGECSVKSDIFSFGVIVLEIVSGQTVGCFRNGVTREDLLSYARKNWREGTPHNIVDPTLRTAPSEELKRCINIALLCVKENPVERPSIGCVAFMLNSYSQALPMCEYDSGVTESIQSTGKSEKWSIYNPSTSTELEPGYCY